MKRSIIALIMALAMILTLVACGNSNGDNNNGGNDVKAIQLSLGHTNNTDHHYQVLAESFKKIVEEKSNGQLIINIFPAEQLGSGSEMLESVKSGTQDMVLDPDAYLANYDPLFNVIAMPYDTTTQEPHNVTGHRDNHDGSHSNICGSCGYSAKVSHSYTWAPNANDNEKHIGTCVCGNVVERYHNFVGDVCSDCGYDKSTGTTCEHVWTTEWTIDTVDNEYHWHKCIKCNAITDKKPHAYTIVTDSGTNHIRECECKVFYVEDHISSDWIIDTPATATTAGSMHKECTVCKHKMQTEVIPATGEIEPPTPDNPGTIVIIRPAEEEKPAQQPNPSTGANDLVGLAVAAAVAAALGSAALLRKHD